VQNDYSGLLLVNKPSGITSFKLVNLIKKKLQVKKAGHCGTLDTLARGLMLVLIGKATNLLDKFMNQHKV
jgi:tRNA pseudouridine55 synthase